jgi:hypothetical protein
MCDANDFLLWPYVLLFLTAFFSDKSFSVFKKQLQKIPTKANSNVVFVMNTFFLSATVNDSFVFLDTWGGDITTAAILHLAHLAPPKLQFTATDFNR